ncbi:ester cyclase [Streptomyces turgidiscabies]|uniref:SnoaL-like polyketide cyclase n=1 Tax=Streptomyces turgidiscabies (strain Car8) TaxID=698760 RepID=L7ETR6_STRT8|nr:MULTISPECIES: nuclear transport factor 2 family protein [Streptomyces]ELP62274.1 SnoaL-like polyketide cyclase [Streptomyces turgidiscabies Car8]MDX3498765.1 nuclear transport factor 2 family protein [Streptomyces turgidiscabies]GAQ74808.1 SnoaL-like domain protein [Streptomyces turgidiscabies]
MGQAREVMDRLTEAITSTPDLKAIAELYAPDAVAVTPDGGEIHGRDNIVDYWRQMTDAVPDGTYESVHSYEIGDTAIDEGFFSGRNTGSIPLSSGEHLPATNKEIRIRGVDFATVRDGHIVDYRLYFDQMEFLGQLGLLPDELA